MSISDSEDHDSKPSAQPRPTETPPRRQKRGAPRAGGANNNFNGDNSQQLLDGSTGGVVQNMTLSSEQQMELSYQRTVSLLRGAAHDDDDDDSNNGGGNKEIIVMPSLVSLSDDFFKIHVNNINDDGNNDDALDGSAVPSLAGATILPDLPSINNHRDDRGGGQTSNSSVASVAAAAATVGTNNPSSVVPRLRPRLNLRGNNSSMSSSSDVSMTHDSSSGGGGPSNLGNVGMSRPREDHDWPIGPQGAQVPSYLLERLNSDSNINAAGNHQLTHSSSTNSLVDTITAAESNAAAASLESNTPPSAPPPAAAGRNLLDSPQRSAARRVREIMTRQQQQQQRQPSPVHFINAAQSLEHAVQRLEETLRQRDVDGHDLSHRGLPGSGAYSISSPGGGGGGRKKKKNPSMEDVEVGTLTQLAEIMLHPPTEIVNGRYCWREEEEEEVKGKAMGDNDDVGIDCGSGGDEEVDGGPMMMMMTSSPPSDTMHGGKMEIGGDDDNVVGGEGNGKDYNDDDEMMPDDGDDMTNKSPSHSSLLLPITSLVNKKSRYPTLNAAETSISTLGKSCPTRRVCQHPFRRNDIVWVCRTCQSDETCVLCHDCFSNSNHEGHDVAFYHAQAGGCCDCGDADAWDPKGFCNKHGGHNGQGAPPGTDVAKAEAAVLGSVHACADWLVDVVQSGVEGGYRRANPLPLVSVDGKRSSAGMARADSALPESYEEPELGRDRLRERNVRRERSLTRRNTVADMETSPGTAEDDGSRASNFMRASNSLMSIEAVFSEAASTDFDESGHGVGSRVSTPIIHEVQFDPAAASNSRRRSESNATTNSSKRDADTSIDDNVFCPTAASTSKSSSSHQRATKKARAPPKSPARALGDLGRDGCGLFLVIHSDDIRIGAHSPNEATNALKEFFSKSVSANAGGAVTSGWDAVSGNGGGFYFSGSAGPFPRADNDGRVNRPNIRIAPRISRFRTSNLDSIVEKIVRIIKKRGELIVWGTQELLAECGDVTARCWRDGDPNSSSLIGAAMLNRAKVLTDGGLVCSIKTRKEVVNEQTATSVIKLINLVAQSCDPLCDQVSSGISGRGITSTLPPLLRNDLKLPYKLVSSWHALLLTLLAVPNFKASLANAYCDTYRAVTGEYARGVGLIERSSYTLSVQFLNRISYVTELVRERSLITNLFLCLYEILSLATITEVPTPVMRDFEAVGTSNLIAAIMVLLGHASLVGADDESLFRAFDAELNDIMNRSGGDSRHHGRVSTRGLTREHHRNLIERSAMLNPKLDPTHNALAHRRYSVCISDLKCVLNVDGMARHFASVPCKGGVNVPSALNAWIKTLSLAQNMDGQCWKDYSQPHVERENSAWVGAFNTSISLGSLYERLLKWDDTDPSPINDSVTPVQLLSCAELCYYTLTKGVDRWQRGEILSCRPTPAPSSMKVDHALKSASLPFSTVASAHGTPLAMTALPLSQLEPFSFHLPLHRFAAACAREVCRRTDDSGGLLKLIDKFRVNSNASDEDREKQMRKNDLLFRGMMEFPVIVLSRAAQIRASIWKRNGPGMSDMVLNYSEPPFCRNLQDADIFLVQLALVCMATLVEDEEDEMENDGLSLFSGAGTARLVNLLVHRFGVFSFLGFEMAPPTDLDRYIGEIRSGMYPAEIKPTDKDGDNSSVSSTPAMPWTYTPARDSSHEMFLLGELLHLFITLISELPPPPAEDESQHAIEARRRLMREVIHRLASGPKTHSEMTEVSHILSNRDTDALCELGKKINPDDASGAALEEALNEVGTRKCKSGAPDEWELKESAWSEYDPNFQHISTRAHQHASENRPKQKADAACLPYAPRPLPSHNLFNRLRRDFTADTTLLACVYRVLHVHCHRPSVVLKDYPGRNMYEADASETVLARAIHLLTLGVYAWDGDVPTGSIDSANWRSQGGDGVASVFVNFDRPPTASDWVEKVLLRNPYEIMRREEYRDDDGCGEQNILWLLRQVALETQTREQDMSGFLGGLDQSLKSGAMFICNFAAKVNPEASAIVAKHFKVNLAKGNADDLAKRKNAAKEKALAAMKAQMAKFAANLGGDDEDDRMSDAEGSKTSNRDDERLLATPLRQRTDSTGLEAMDLSPHGEFLLTPSIHPSTPFTPRTPQTPLSPGFDGQNESSARLFTEIPRCIICGADDKIDCDNNADSSTMFQQKEKRTLAFCGFSQASRVIQGGSGEPSALRDEEKKTWRHVGVHTALCGHAIHKSCCETYIKTSHRDRLADRLEGGKRREFRCPLCQRLSNCLVPFVDVAADWLDSPNTTSEMEAAPSIAAGDGMAVDGLSCNDSYKSLPLHDFLSSSRWWTTKNDIYVWDGRCNFTPAIDTEEKKVSSTRNEDETKKNLQGKKELIKAWNNVLRTPRRLQRRSRPSGFVLTPPGSTGQKDSNNSDILRKLMDQIVDVGQRADLKRLGEEELSKEYGEFRHYLTERTIYNKRQRAAGKEALDWPLCLTSSSMSETRRQELSKEKMVSKLLYSIQAFTYSCCSESSDCRRLLHSKPVDTSSIYSKFGVGKAVIENNLLLLPRAELSVDGGFQPFDGRLGKTRYMGLALMAAASPVAKEIVQLCIPFPPSSDSSQSDSVFDFDADDDSRTKRAPVAYPLLCSHILTHTAGALIAVTGSARVDEGSCSTDEVVDDCRKFISLGLVARIVQVLLTGLMSWNEEQIDVVLRSMRQEMIDDTKQEECSWRQSCLDLLRIIFAREGEKAFPETANSDANLIESKISKGIDSAKEAAVSFLLDAAVIAQILIPNIFSDTAVHPDNCPSDLDKMQRLMEVIRMESIHDMIQSSLVQQLIKSWYVKATEKHSSQLLPSPAINYETWPVARDQRSNTNDEIPPHCSPLLGYPTSTSPLAFDPASCRITCLPKSYTDLYAQLSALCPDNDQIALCLICGSVLNAGGKGECTKHASKCGGGAGVFFLVQECVGLIMHGTKAAYVPSIFVDSHGETPQYRGRPLNLDPRRWNLLQDMWCSHSVREKVISERSTTRQVIIPNYY